ncbi:hypothetical protein AJ79_01934 [Helicocarpus griseus UAMH5409]|uniref:Saponin hydrolase n=1 Tax=Helicocarpus griseus UAMH5409 TaxID=1447875 RepID=A0A2B7Y6A2_9EURO|nr:hypothetical protein AJ79_01934 [Helicocarpus griseus UAMH5409]
MRHHLCIAGAVFAAAAYAESHSPPPDPEPIEIIELPLPPVAASDQVGSCTPELNPHRTGCIPISSDLRGGNFLPDGNHVIASLNFTGSPPAPDPASIYHGLQFILVKADGSVFDNGDPWKCITCGMPDANKVAGFESAEYPQAFKDGKRALVGNYIIDCGSALLASPECTPEQTHIYPVVWSEGKIRELRIHPDNVHLGFNSFTQVNGKLGQFAYFGRMQFNGSHYEVIKVTRLFNPDNAVPLAVQDGRITLNPEAISVGELRGFSGSGREVTYIGYPFESSNMDACAVDLTTGKVRRITSHPEYVDPLDISPDDKWTVILDTRGSNRQMWLSGMRGIPPITDMITTSAISSTRNNGQRRFFQPFLLDHDGDRGSYFGQQLNGAGDGSPGAINDPNWNARADPKWSPDGTRITYYQALVTAPACGEQNPLPCPNSTAPGGRVDRLMLATLTNRKPLDIPPVTPASDDVPWGVPVGPNTPPPSEPQLPKIPQGNYTLDGKVGGFADVEVLMDDAGTSIRTIGVVYHDFSNDGINILRGTERVTVTLPSISKNLVDWYSDLTSTGGTKSTKKTSPEGFHLEIDTFTNIFYAEGSMVTTVDGEVYEQPANWT